MKTPFIQLTIDGKKTSVPKGTTVYTAARQLGIEIPIFCYQDRMPPFGACRICLVEVEKMGKLQASCTLEATEGMVVNTGSEHAIEGRKGIIELLLINHPLDCPICDRGGECPLQEHTIHHGPGTSRFFEEKRHFVKPYSLGPVLMLDRERCIVCARCTRFGDIIAGDHALEFIERGYRTEVGTPNGGPVESKFIGNTIMICPVGALTSKVYRFQARPWDNYSTPSTCTLCPVGCSLILDNRDGEIMRTRSQENPQVNDIWLCDKGWFGYEFSDDEERLQQPLLRRNGAFEEVSWEEALTFIAEKLKEAKSEGKVAALGGNPLTTEENYLFQKLIRTAARATHVDHRVGMTTWKLEEEGIGPGMELPIEACEELPLAILLGLDLTEEFPVIWLRLKQSLNRRGKAFFFGHYAPEIAPFMTQTVLHPPGKEIEIFKAHLPQLARQAQKEGRGSLFVGRQYLAHPNRKEILSELLKLCQTVPELTLNIMEGRGNSMGARVAGMHPQLAPLGLPLNKPGLNWMEVLQETAINGWDFLYVAGANPAEKIPSTLWADVRNKLGCLVVQDLFLTETAQAADVVLPSLSFVEKQGTFLNIEGRVQKLQAGRKIRGLYSDGEIFTLLAQKLEIELTIDPLFTERLKQGRLSLGERKQEEPLNPQRPTLRKEGLAATFAPSLFDQGVRMQHNQHLIQLAKEARVRLHPLEGARLGIHNGERAQLKTQKGSLVATIQWDDKVAEGTAVIPLGFTDIPAYELDMKLLNGLEIELIREI